MRPNYSDSSVWIVESGDYEQRRICCVAVSREAAVAAVKAMYGPPYIVDWQFNEKADALIGQFQAVDHYSTAHVAVFDLEQWAVEVLPPDS